jgi:hypothetical protein
MSRRTPNATGLHSSNAEAASSKTVKNQTLYTYSLMSLPPFFGPTHPRRPQAGRNVLPYY